MVLFFVYLAAPLAAATVFAFNDSLFPSPPWMGFTMDRFFNDTEPKIGMFHDRRLMRVLQNSLLIGVIVASPSVAVGRGRHRANTPPREKMPRLVRDPGRRSLADRA